MSSADTFFLTADERRLFHALPREVRTPWEESLIDEVLTAYETPADLRSRRQSMPFNRYPELKNLIEKIDASVPADELSFDALPAEAVPLLLAAIGAAGVSAVIEALLKDDTAIRSSDDLEGVAALSRARHQMLEDNVEAGEAL